MTAEEKTEVIQKILAKTKAAGIKTRGNYITVEEMLISPDVAKVLFGDLPWVEVEMQSGGYEADDFYTSWMSEEDARALEDFDDERIKDETPAWRYHQHQLLDFMQSYNTDEMLRYVASFL